MSCSKCIHHIFFNNKFVLLLEYFSNLEAYITVDGGCRCICARSHASHQTNYSTCDYVNSARTFPMNLEITLLFLPFIYAFVFVMQSTNMYTSTLDRLPHCIIVCTWNMTCYIDIKFHFRQSQFNFVNANFICSRDFQPESPCTMRSFTTQANLHEYISHFGARTCIRTHSAHRRFACGSVCVSIQIDPSIIDFYLQLHLVVLNLFVSLTRCRSIYSHDCVYSGRKPCGRIQIMHAK